MHFSVGFWIEDYYIVKSSLIEKKHENTMTELHVADIVGLKIMPKF